MTVSASDLKMGKGQSKVYVAKESFKPPTDDGTTCGYIAFEARWWSLCQSLFSITLMT